nr:origin recognition complex subunit 5 isoform X1 [Paramormyrops kingsleyae]
MPAELRQQGYSEAQLRLVSEKVPCREAQAAALLALFGEPDHYSFPSIFIYGHRAMGKSHVTLTLLRELQVRDALELQTPWRLLKALLNLEDAPCGGELRRVRVSRPALRAGAGLPLRLIGRDPVPQPLPVRFRAPVPTAVRGGFSQAHAIHRLGPGGGLAGHERQSSTWLSALTGTVINSKYHSSTLICSAVQGQVEDNVTVILLSEIVWDKFRPSTGCFEPLQLHFPDYSKAELQQILAQDSHPSYSAELYTFYINILLGVFYSVCKDLRELRHLAALNFPKFCEPLEKGEAEESDTHKLWRNIEPHLKKAMQTVYLREVSSFQWEEQLKQDGETQSLRGLSAYAHVELPYYSKFLLIAAYLASYNPARTDRRFFVKHHGKIRKTTFLKKHEKTSNHLLGPKPFPLDRLLAIFYSVVDSRVAPTASIFSQISSLVTLQLLTQVGHDDQLDNPKYKCTVSLDFIRAIARTVGFDILRYLYDFL